MVLWTRHLLHEIGCDQEKATILYQDNQGSITWETEGFRNAKHVAIRGNFVKSHVQSGSVSIKYCPTERMLADILTKSLERQKFESQRSSLGVFQLQDNVQSKAGN